jgi:hypothetical protein
MLGTPNRISMSTQPTHAIHREPIPMKGFTSTADEIVSKPTLDSSFLPTDADTMDVESDIDGKKGRSRSMKAYDVIHWKRHGTKCFTTSPRYGNCSFDEANLRNIKFE